MRPTTDSRSTSTALYGYAYAYAWRFTQALGRWRTHHASDLRSSDRAPTASARAVPV